MQFSLTPEQQLIADTARGLFVGFAASRAGAIASEEGFDRGQWHSVVREMGFGALTLEERLGGSGLGAVELALVMIEAGRTLHPSPFLSSIAIALPLLRAAGEQDTMKRVASGELIAAPLLLGEGAIRADGMLRGEGLAPFGPAADMFVVVACDRIAVVPRDLPGIAVSPRTSMDETRPLASVRLDVPVSVVVEGAAVGHALDLARVALAAECVGGADAVLDMTVDYAKQRIQFGRPIGSFQAIKHRLADMMIEVEAARTAVYYAAAAADEHDPAFAEAAAIAHATAIEAFQMCAGHAIQLHGGIGFTWEHDAHRYFKRARSAATLLGTPVQSRERLARLIGLDAVAA